MRVLMLAERYGPLGGTERYLDIVVPALRAAGDEVLIAAADVASGADALRIPWADEHEPGDAAAAARVRALIAEFRPDVAVLQNVMDAAVTAAARAAPRLVYQLHDHRPFCPNGDRRFPRSGRPCRDPMGAVCMVRSVSEGCVAGPRPRTRSVLRGRERLRDAIAASDAVIANSPFVARLAQRNGIAGAFALAPPLSEDAFAPAPAVPGSGLLFVGRVQPQKGLRSLVRALARIPAAQRPPLRVVGEGPDLRAATADAAEGGVLLTAAGLRDAKGVRDELDAAAALVVPSLWDEPFGLVGLEAFARARPVAAYDVGGVSWWLRDGRNGALVPRGDERALGAAVLRVLADARALGAAGYADAQAYRSASLLGGLRAAYAG